MSTRRRPPLAVLPVASVAIQLIGTAVIASHQGRTLSVAAVLLLLLGPAFLLLRRVAPGPMVAASAAVALLYLWAGFPPGPFALSLVLALVLALAAGARWWAWGSVAGFASGFVYLSLNRGVAGQTYAVLGWAVVIVLGGELLRMARLRAAERRRAEAERRRHQRDEERLVLARDIHDVVAHSLSMINVQASVALHLSLKDPNPQKLLEALENIKYGSGQALAEVREVLSVLRHDAPRMPSQRLAQLPELVNRVSSKELSLRFESDLSQLPAWVDERVENTIYRVVQESLTNIVRHARATQALIKVQIDREHAEVSIADDGVGMGLAAEGNGLQGLRERVQQLGGTVAIGSGELPAAKRSGALITVRIPAPQEEK